MRLLKSSFMAMLIRNSSVNGADTCEQRYMCGVPDPTPEHFNEARDLIQEWNKWGSKIATSEVIRINTIWHRVRIDGMGNTNEDIAKNMKVLNGAFEPHFIFILDKIETSNNSYFWNGDSYGRDMRAHLHQGDCSTLNIYSTSFAIDGIAAYPRRCQYNPLLDGVMIDYETFPGGKHRK